MNLRMDDKEYSLLDRAENIEGAEIINDGLNYCRNMIENQLFSDELERINFDGIYTYNSLDVNAVAWGEGGTYTVAVSFGFFLKTYKWFELWKKAPKINEIFGFKDGITKETFFENCYVFSIMFIIAHEIYHILNGHCDIKKTSHQIVESIKNISDNENLFSQVLEYDADFCASRHCISVILNYDGELESKYFTVRNFLFALYNVFLIFSQGEENDFNELINEKIDMYDHPHPSIRIVYCTMATFELLSHYWDMNSLVILYSQSVNDCISFDRILIMHNKLKDCLYSFAYTEKGTQHIKFLNNRCKKISKTLRKHAHISLHDYPLINALPSWITDQGEFMKMDASF